MGDKGSSLRKYGFYVLGNSSYNEYYKDKKRRNTDDIPNDPPTSLANASDKLCIEFIICIPGTTSQSDARLELLEHINLAGCMLNGLDTLNEVFLSERFKGSIDEGLVEGGFGLEMFRPYPFVSCRFDMVEDEIFFAS